MNIYKRQTNLVKPDQLDFPILLIGCGGTGSWTGIALARMGCSNITLIDFDKIESHNIPSQAFLPKHILNPKSKGGNKKVVALYSMLHEINRDYQQFRYWPIYKTFEEYFNRKPKEKFSIVICAIDSMDERIKLWDVIKKRNDVELFLDPRIGGELLRMYAVDPLDTKAVTFYESQLYPSSKADPLPCGSRQIIYTTMFTGALIANYVKKYAKKEPIRAETIMDFSTMQLL